eukprot:UN1988
MMTGLELPRNARDHCQSCAFVRVVGHAHSRPACVRHRSFEKWLSWLVPRQSVVSAPVQAVSRAVSSCLGSSGVIPGLPAGMEPLAVRSRLRSSAKRWVSVVRRLSACRVRAALRESNLPRHVTRRK